MYDSEKNFFRLIWLIGDFVKSGSSSILLKLITFLWSAIGNVLIINTGDLVSTYASAIMGAVHYETRPRELNDVFDISNQSSMLSH